MVNDKFKLILSVSVLICAFFIKPFFFKSPNDYLILNIQLANIEALASGESTGTSRLKCYKTVEGDENKIQTHETYCGSCTAVLCFDAYDSSHCYP